MGSLFPRHKEEPGRAHVLDVHNALVHWRDTWLALFYHATSRAHYPICLMLALLQCVQPRTDFRARTCARIS
jgi:hypothetical protein